LWSKGRETRCRKTKVGSQKTYGCDEKRKQKWLDPWRGGGEREPNKWKMQKKDGGSDHPFGKFLKVGKCTHA
jgi:hypothetical protein